MQDLNDWANFFIASTGAAAALAGLFIVAISVNVDSIVSAVDLPARVGATLGALVMALSVSLAALLRDQSLTWLGAEVLVLGILAWVAKVHAVRAMLRRSDPLPRRILASEAVSGQSQTIPFLIGGTLLVTGSTGGLAWLGFGVIAVFALSMITTWVLLIEIRR